MLFRNYGYLLHRYPQKLPVQALVDITTETIADVGNFSLHGLVGCLLV
jgi:hypothetical protein